MTGELLIASVAGERFALPAIRIQSAIELDTVVPVPCVPQFILGLTTLRSRTLTVIDTACAIGLDAPASPPRYALVVECDGCGYALAVDAIETVVSAIGEIEPLTVKLTKGWMRIALGKVQTTAGTVLVLDLDRLIAGSETRDAA